VKRSNQRSRGRGGRPGGRGPKRPPIEPLHPTAEPPQIESFREFDLGDDIQEVIAGMGITKPTPIQSLAIGPVLEGRDVIAKAETGTGKTLAFGAPLMSQIDADRASVLGLVLCPTRELAQQVAGVLEELGKARNVRTALIVGGEPMHPQIKALQLGAQVVVGTPGRVLDLMEQGFLSFPWTEFVVLDEADEMLEIGFLPDVEKILSMTPPERRTLLFSATFPDDLLRLARANTRDDPAEVATAGGVSTVDTIHQSFVEVSDTERPRVLRRLIENSAPDDVFLVFCERRTEVDDLFRKMGRMRFTVKALHGGFDQTARFRVMTAFRSQNVKCLLATDVASRGLDVEHVTHVINYSVPHDESAYTHRIGRTGRAGRSGSSITLVTPKHAGRWRDILKRVNWPIEELDVRSIGRGAGRDGARGERERDDRSRGKRRRDDDAPRRRRRRAERDESDRDERDDEAPRSRRRRRTPERERDESDGDTRPRDDDAPRRRRRRAERDEPERDSRGRDDDAPRSRRRRRSAEPSAGPSAGPERDASERDARPRDDDAPRRRRRRAERDEPEREARGLDDDAPRRRRRRATEADGDSDSGRKRRGRQTQSASRASKDTGDTGRRHDGGFGAGLD